MMQHSPNLYCKLRETHSESFYFLNIMRTNIVIQVSSEISDLCEISDLLLFVSYSASQSEGMKFGDYFFDECCVNENFLVRCQISTTRYSRGTSITNEKYWT